MKGKKNLRTLHVMYQTQGRVFHPISKKKRVAAEFFLFLDQPRGVWKSGETLFRVFDIASQNVTNS